MPALQVCLGPDVHSTANFESLQVLKSDPRPDDHAVTEAPRHAAPDDTAHRAVECTIADRETGIELKQALATIPGFEFVAKRDLMVRVSKNLGSPVYCLHRTRRRLVPSPHERSPESQTQPFRSVGASVPHKSEG